MPMPMKTIKTGAASEHDRKVAARIACVSGRCATPPDSTLNGEQRTEHGPSVKMVGLLSTAQFISYISKYFRSDTSEKRLFP
jgi:hypothetical protein